MDKVIRLRDVVDAADVLIIHGDKTLRRVSLSEGDWASIHYVDYVTVDEANRITDDMVVAHAPVVKRMRELLHVS